jgi:hypothetical protein
MDRATNGWGRGDFMYAGGAVRRGRPLSLESNSDRPRMVGCSWADSWSGLSLIAGAVGAVGSSGTGTGGGGRDRTGWATTCTSATFEGGSSPGGSTGEIRCVGGSGKVAVADELIKGDGRIGCLGDGTCNSGIFIRKDFGGSPAKSSLGESG